MLDEGSQPLDFDSDISVGDMCCWDCGAAWAGEEQTCVECGSSDVSEVLAVDVVGGGTD